jgi:hypothetical protein
VRRALATELLKGSADEEQALKLSLGLWVLTERRLGLGLLLLGEELGV